MSTTVAHGTSLDSLKCYQVQPQFLGEIEEEVFPLLQAWERITDGELSAEDVVELTLRGDMQMFVVHTSAAIKLVYFTELVQYPLMKVLRLVGIAGERALGTLKFLPALECWAKANGATAIEGFFTDEAVAYGARMGLRPMYTLMRKRFSTEH
jgi:hypothetical protein